MLIVNRPILDLTTILVILLFNLIIYGIYMPFEFKYGVVITKFIFMVVIFAASFGPILFSDFVVNIKIDFSAWETISSSMKNTALILANIIIFGISMRVSIKIYAKKEL